MGRVELTADGAAFDSILTKIRSGTAKIGVIGLGYVGLPLSLAFSERLRVVGYDSDSGRISQLLNGESYIDDVSNALLQKALSANFKVTSEVDELRACDAIVVCVPTPLDENGAPDLSCVENASDIVARIVRKDMLVVLESTSYPGTTDEFLGSAIKNAGLTPGEDVALAFSPERVDPGNTKFNLSNTPKIVGGCNPNSTEAAAELYSAVTPAGVVKVKDCATAEASKLVENIFRGVNIALINELALIFDRMGINTWEVVSAASTKPFGFMPHYPGPGVGGHCIPLDPIYLSYKARQYGFIPRFIELSREINEYMKIHTVNLTIAALRDTGISKDEAIVGVMGLAYKSGISDTRESPAIKIIEELSKTVEMVLVHDPRVASIPTRRGVFEVTPMEEILSQADCLVFLTAHREYTRLSLEQLLGNHVKAIVDTRNLFDKSTVERHGILYRGIGKGSQTPEEIASRRTCKVNVSNMPV